jgi:hypothetical protein
MELYWGGGGGEGDSKNLFRKKKMVIPIICGVNKQESCRQIFKDYRILTVTSLYILEVLCYIKSTKGI